MHTYMRKLIDRYKHTYLHTYKHVYIYTYKHKNKTFKQTFCKQIYIHQYTYLITRANLQILDMQPDKRTQMQTCIHTLNLYVQKYAHAY